jgi:WD40 repeat protein
VNQGNCFSCNCPFTISHLWSDKSRQVSSASHTDTVFAVRSVPMTKARFGAGDRTVKIWDLASGTRMYTSSEPADVVQSVAFQPSGTGTRLSAAGNDNTIRTWELTSKGGTLVRSIRAHNAPILRIAYSPDGTLLASTASDRTVKIWNAATGAEVRTLERQSDWARALAWSPDSRRLAVGRYDGTVVVYDGSTGRRVAQVTPLDAVCGVWCVRWCW